MVDVVKAAVTIVDAWPRWIREGDCLLVKLLLGSAWNWQMAASL